MSYILDALRRAQAERERGQVPGLHAQPGLGGAQRTRHGAAGAAARLPWLWAVGGAVLVALVLVPVLWMTRGGGSIPPEQSAGGGPVLQAVPAAGPQAPSAVEAPPPLVVVSANPAARSGVAAAPAGPPTAVAARPGVAPAPAGVGAARAPAPPAPATAPATAPVSQPQPAPVPTPTNVAPQPPAAIPAAEAATAPAPAAPVASTRAATAAATSANQPLPPMLTAEQRRDWPPLALGGSVWSETPSARFVILGGQVVREGDSTPDGVQVERITPKAVVLRWRELRGTLPF